MPHTHTAIITGGGVRVGKVLALGLAKAGYDIALHYHQSEESAQQVAAEISALGRHVTLHEANLAETHTISPLMEAIFAAHKSPMALINNASIFEAGEFADTSPELLQAHMQVNFTAPFFLSQHFAQLHGAHSLPQANIINVLDSYIQSHGGRYFAYLLSKKTLAHFTQMAAKALGPQIRVNGVAPGILLPSGEFGTDFMAEKAAEAPLKSLASPEDVTSYAKQIIENPTLTGQILYCDGGLHLV